MCPPFSCDTDPCEADLRLAAFLNQCSTLGSPQEARMIRRFVQEHYRQSGELPSARHIIRIDDGREGYLGRTVDFSMLTSGPVQSEER